MSGSAPILGSGWGSQIGFLQRRQPAFWLFVILLLFTGRSVVGDQLALLDVVPTAWVLSWVLLLLYAVPVALLIYRLDLFEREPASLIAAALAWGGIVAIDFAGRTNDAWFEILAKIAGPELTINWGAALIAPPVEEGLKIFGVIAIVLIARREIDDLFDGFVYGAMVGLGFTVVEDVSYFMRFVAEAGGTADQVGPVLHGFFIRVIASGLYGHVLYTGVAGIGVAFAATRVGLPPLRRYGTAIAAIAAGMLGHGFWNSPLLADALLGGDPGPVDWILYGAAKGVPFLIFVGILVRLATRREVATFAALVGAHLADDVITAAELDQLGGLTSRRAARKRIGAKRGPAGERLAGEIQREQVRLALAASRAGRDDAPEVLASVDRVRTLKAQLSALPLRSGAAATLAGPGSGSGPGWAGGATPVGGAVSTTGVTTSAAAEAAAAEAAAAQAPPPPPPWWPTHLVPADGLPAWDLPDGSRPPIAMLAARLELVVDERAGEWARVRAVNGWTGWLDGRRLEARPSQG